MRRTTLCYLKRNNEVLLLHRTKKKNDVNSGKWIGVGGGIEPGETPEEGVKREILEETGYIARKCVYRGVVFFHSDEAEDEEMHLFTCDDFSGDEIVCDEGDLAWIPEEKTGDLPTWEGDRVFMKLIKDDAPFFRLDLCYHGDSLVSAILDGDELPL